MLLQPLIENSLQHGLGESGRLELWIFEDTSRNYAAIIVRDYGEGLNMEEYDRICRPLGVEPESPQKAGIGFRYVRYMNAKDFSMSSVALAVLPSNMNFTCAVNSFGTTIAPFFVTGVMFAGVSLDCVSADHQCS